MTIFFSFQPLYYFKPQDGNCCYRGASKDIHCIRMGQMEEFGHRIKLEHRAQDRERDEKDPQQQIVFVA